MLFLWSDFHSKYKYNSMKFSWWHFMKIHIINSCLDNFKFPNCLQHLTSQILFVHPNIGDSLNVNSAPKVVRDQERRCCRCGLFTQRLCPPLVFYPLILSPLSHLSAWLSYLLSLFLMVNSFLHLKPSIWVHLHSDCDNLSNFFEWRSAGNKLSAYVSLQSSLLLSLLKVIFTRK